jgi:hypothetical protein
MVRASSWPRTPERSHFPEGDFLAACHPVFLPRSSLTLRFGHAVGPAVLVGPRRVSSGQRRASGRSKVCQLQWRQPSLSNWVLKSFGNCGLVSSSLGLGTALRYRPKCRRVRLGRVDPGDSHKPTRSPRPLRKSLAFGIFLYLDGANLVNFLTHCDQIWKPDFRFDL